MAHENVITTTEGGIGIVTINRPTKLNALNRATILELSEAITALDDDAATRVIIVTGSGEKAFVAGADIAEFSEFNVEEGEQLASLGQQLLFDMVQNLATPVIAAINGFALGGGLELAMAAHFRVASDNAKMGLPEVSLGLIPGNGGTQRLPQLIGKGRAMEMIMTAAMITADEAKAYGLVNHVVPQPELLDFCKGIADKIMKNSPVAISKAITAINASFTSDGFATEITGFGESFGTEDFKEGTTAFIEKRKAVFTGR